MKFLLNETGPNTPQIYQSDISHGEGTSKYITSTRYRPVTLTRESQIIVGICLLDLVVTLALLSSSMASEGNPLMNFYLKFGVGAFVAAKLCLLFAPIFIAEYCRQFRPKFVRRCLRLCIVAYLGIYGVLFLQHNVPVLMAGEEDFHDYSVAASQLYEYHPLHSAPR